MKTKTLGLSVLFFSFCSFTALAGNVIDLANPACRAIYEDVRDSFKKEEAKVIKRAKEQIVDDREDLLELYSKLSPEQKKAIRDYSIRTRQISAAPQMSQDEKARHLKAEKAALDLKIGKLLREEADAHYSNSCALFDEAPSATYKTMEQLEPAEVSLPQCFTRRTFISFYSPKKSKQLFVTMDSGTVKVQACTFTRMSTDPGNPYASYENIADKGWGHVTDFELHYLPVSTCITMHLSDFGASFENTAPKEALMNETALLRRRTVNYYAGDHTEHFYKDGFMAHVRKLAPAICFNKPVEGEEEFAVSDNDMKPELVTSAASVLQAPAKAAGSRKPAL